MLARPRFFIQSLAIVLSALWMNGCIVFCILTPSCRDKSSSDELVVAPDPVVSVIVNPLKVEVLPGGSATATVTVGVSGGPSGAALTIGALPAGVSATFSPTTVAGSGSSVLTFTASPSALPGLLIVDVTATTTGQGSGTVARSTVTAEVLKPFQLLAPSSQSVTQGTSIDVPIAIARATGFSGAVTVTLDPGTVPAGTTITFNPTPLTASSAVLTLAVPDSAPTGRYLVRMMGSSSAVTDTASRWLLNVLAVPVPPEISITGTPAAATVAPAGSTSFDLIMTRSAPGLGNIGLTVSGLPAGATAAFTPQSVSGTTSQLVVTTLSSTPDGSYPLIVTATAGALVRHATLTLNVVTPADFALTTTPTTLTVARGATGQTTVAIQRTGAPGSVSLEVTGLPSGVSALANPVAVAGNASVITVAVGAGAAPGSYALAVRGIAGALTRTTPLTLIVPAPPASAVTLEVLTPSVTIAPRQTALIPVRITRTGTFVGRSVELRLSGSLPGGSAWMAPVIARGDTAMLQVIGGTPGVTVLTVLAEVGSLPSPSATATVNVVASTAVDFSLLPRPQKISVSKGSSETLDIDILRANGFSGAVSFDAVTADPQNLTVSFAPDLTAGNGVQMTVYASSNSLPGLYLVVVRGRSGGLTRFGYFSVLVEDGYSYTPPYLTRPPGSGPSASR